ncbi:MAG: universal stress protein [bacterium]|nr:universal stress protein [bacterium]
MPSKIRRILVPIDFSSTAANALTLATHLARRFDAEMHVLHVRVVREEPHLDAPSLDQIDRLTANADLETEKALSHRNKGDADVVTHPHLARGIAASEVITEMCRSLECDVVVMGTHGRRGIKSVLLGSVAEAVVRTAPVPVLTVRPSVEAPTDSIQRILVPHDFSAQSEAALDVASDWARVLEAGVTLIHVVEPVVYPEFYAIDTLGDHALEKIKARSLEALEQVATTHLADVDCEVKVLVGRAGEMIAQYAGDGSFQLLVMGTRGMSALEHLLLGSVADFVLRRCPVPLLAVRS